MNRRILFLYIALSFCGAGLHSQEVKKLRIAILDIKAGTSISKSEAETVTGFLTTEMINCKEFQIIDRQNISRVLKEQELILKGCTDTACDVRVGQLLAANKILTGNVSKFGDNYSLSVFLTDVEKGTQDMSEKVNSPSLGGLELAAEKLVKKLIARMQEGDEPNPKPKDIEVIPKKTEDKTGISTQQKDISGAIWRSALIPGWGQFYQEENGKGSIFIVSFLGGIGLFASESSSHSAAKGNYNSANNLGLIGAFMEPRLFGILSYSQATSARQTMNSSASAAQIGSGIAVTAYLISLLDVTLFGNRGLTARESGFQFRANPQNPISADSYSRSQERTMSIEYRWRF